MKDPAVKISGLTKRYGEITAVDQVDLNLYPGEILALVGPSGCGKTTLLRLIAGFELPDAGEVILQGRLAVSAGYFLPPEQRGVGMVFQDYALFPHLTVAQNVGFGLSKHPRRTQEEQVRTALSKVGLQVFESRYPHELSGGERQRVALARALAPKPVLILLDEPFSNLDADRRVQMREEVRSILKEAGATAIFVTHDQEEALFMGDRLAVFQQGRLEQVGSPEAVFHTPGTRFVAEFMGQTDFLPGEVVPEGILTEIGLLRQPVDLPACTAVEVALRADDVSFEPREGSPAVVEARHFKGAINVYRLRLPSGRVLHSLQPHTRLVQPGTRVRVYADPNHALACFSV